MNRVDRHRHVVSPQQGLQCGQDLLRQTLLHLRTLGKELHDAVDLGQANDRIFWNIGHRRFTIDGHKVMLAGAGQRDIAYRHHLIDLHLVFNDGDFREVRVIQAGENFVDVHFRDAVRRLHQAVVAQIEIQQLHDLRHMAGDQTLAGNIVQLLHGRAQWRFKTARNQRFMDKGSFFTE